MKRRLIITSLVFFVVLLTIYFSRERKNTEFYYVKFYWPKMTIEWVASSPITKKGFYDYEGYWISMEGRNNYSHCRLNVLNKKEALKLNERLANNRVSNFENNEILPDLIDIVDFSNFEKFNNLLKFSYSINHYNPNQKQEIFSFLKSSTLNDTELESIKKKLKEILKKLPDQ